MIPVITPAVMQEEEKLWLLDPLEKIHIAANALFKVLLKHIKPTDHLFFITGKGLNGADALCLAKLCHQAGFNITIAPVFTQETFKAQTIHFYHQLDPSLIQPFQLPTQKHTVIIDGVFGAGFKGDLPPQIASIFEQLNHTMYKKIAIDIPSGIAGDTGEGKGALECDVTLSIGFPKWGLFIKQGRYHAGRIEHVDIGLSQKMAEKKALAHLLLPTNITLPYEKPFFHKYQRGQVLALASSASFKGASFLMTKAAYRTGAGIVRLFHKEQELFFDNLTPEVTQHTFKELETFLSKKPSSLLLGPGLILTAELEQKLAHLLTHHTLPTLLDGGALIPSLLKHLHPEVVLTPHLEELRRLLSQTSADFDQLLLNSQTLLNSKATVVLKGHHSWILHKDKKPLICASAPPALATAGSGDVLSGIISCFLAKNIGSYTAATLGVALHSVAADAAAKAQSPRSFLASDLIASLPQALNLLS